MDTEASPPRQKSRKLHFKRKPKRSTEETSESPQKQKETHTHSRRYFDVDDSESERRRRRKSHRHFKRKEQHSEQEAVNDSSSSTHTSFLHPPRHFGDDLFRAEQYETYLKDEQSWSAKLTDLLAEDTSEMPFEGRQDDALWEAEMRSMPNPIRQEVPKRWRDAARGFETDTHRGSARLNEMNDEEYSEYIREGVYRRKHASEIKFEEERQRKWQEKQQRRQRRKDEEREKHRRREVQMNDKAKRDRMTKARLEWDAKWGHISQHPEVAWTMDTIPWPSLLDAGCMPSASMPFDKRAVKAFLFLNSSEEEGARRLRSALRRYHPDRFLSSAPYIQISDESERSRIYDMIHLLSKVLSDIVDERRA